MSENWEETKKKTKKKRASHKEESEQEVQYRLRCSRENRGKGMDGKSKKATKHQDTHVGQPSWLGYTNQSPGNKQTLSVASLESSPPSVSGFRFAYPEFLSEVGTRRRRVRQHFQACNRHRHNFVLP